MRIDWKLVVDLMKALAWPGFSVFAVFLLRRPLAELVAQIARRARKFSVYEISVELATLPELSSSWSAGSADVRQLTSSQVFDSASQTLFQELLTQGQADYAVVDLGTGHKWLTSRLFIFALILGLVRGLRAFVFLETSSVTRKRFLGVATPSDVYRLLAVRYPWLEEAHLRAAASQYGAVADEKPGISRFSNQLPVFFASDQWRITSFVNAFISNIQRTTPPPDDEKTAHLEIGTSPQTWERAHWIDGERLERDLAGALTYAWCEESLDQPESSTADSIIRRSGDFVAFVDKDRRFLRLVDRHALLERVSYQRDNVRNPSGDSKTN
jgi:hypothetical protein